MTYELEILKQLSADPSLDSNYVLTTQEGPAIKKTFFFENWRALSSRYSDRVKMFNVAKGCHKLGITVTRVKLAQWQ